MDLNKEKTHVKLIFNPGSGENLDSPVQLTSIINELQASGFIAETYLINSDSNLSEEVRDAIKQGIEMFVVCGGDGTVSSAARELYGKNVTLGIVPTGTQNNIAFSLGIPSDIPSAISLLQTGLRKKVDVGLVNCGENHISFLEVCSVGLFSSIFSSADDIQHGNLLRIGDFLTELVTTQPAEIHLLLDNEREILTTGHVMLISNMPYVIRHFQVGSATSFNDGMLDVLLFANMSKLDLVGYAINGQRLDQSDDPRIHRFRIRKAEIYTDPAMPVMADGIDLGEGRITVEVQKSALSVMTPCPAPKATEKPGDRLEKESE